MRKLLMVGFACVGAFFLGCSHTQHAYSPNAEGHVLAGEQAFQGSGPIASNDGHVLVADQAPGASAHHGRSVPGGDHGSVQHSATTDAVESHLASSDHQHALAAGTPGSVQPHEGLYATHAHELGAIRDTLYRMIVLVQRHTGDEHLLKVLEDHHYLATSHSGEHDAVEYPHEGKPPHAIEHRPGAQHGRHASHHGDEHHGGHHEPGRPDEAEHHQAARHGHGAEHKHVHHDVDADHDLVATLRSLDELFGELKQHLIDLGLRHEAASHERLQDHTAASNTVARQPPCSHEPLAITGSKHPVSTDHEH